MIFGISIIDQHLIMMSKDSKIKKSSDTNVSSKEKRKPKPPGKKKEETKEAEKDEKSESGTDEKKIENIPDFDEEKQCPLCIETYTWSGTHKRVVCQYCNYAACRECVETTLIDPEARRDPECFACHRVWTREFIHGNFTKAFQFGELKNHREQVLFDREKSLLPATQTILVELERRRKEDKALMDEENRLKKEAERIKERRRDVRNQRFVLANEDVTNLGMEKVEHKTFIRPCPVADCRGYLSTRWKCPICEIWVCKNCHVTKKSENDDEHKCKEDDVKTAEMIMNDTKPCPKCGTRIFKNGGCPQMWCTNCHTGFSWQTGKIVTGPVHNPHYFEWMAKNGTAERNSHLPHQNDGCGEINIHMIASRAGCSNRHVNWYDIVRFINEVADNLTNYPTENTNTYLPLRLSFLKGEISEVQFKRSLQMKEKRLSKLREEKEILQTFVTVSREELVKISDQKSRSEDITSAHERLLDLREYLNSQLINLGSRYNNMCRAIDTKEWKWSDTNILQGKKNQKSQKKLKGTMPIDEDHEDYDENLNL